MVMNNTEIFPEDQKQRLVMNNTEIFPEDQKQRLVGYGEKCSRMPKANKD